MILTWSEIASIAALLISTTSLGFSAYFGLRDRGKIKTTSKYVPESEFERAYISISIINTGRRPIVVRIIGGSDNKGHWAGTFLSEDKSGLRLAEHDRHDLTFSREDLTAHTPDDHIEYADLWVEDSLGRRYPVQDAKKNIKAFLDEVKKERKLLLLDE